MRAIPPREIGDWQPYVFYDKCFSPGECEAIIHLSKALRPEPALTGGNAGQPVPEIRASEVRWLRQTKPARWVFEKLGATIKDIQQHWYPFSLTGFMEPIQITRYLASEGGHYDTHRDFGAGSMSTRKLSIVIPLTDRAEYDGGVLEVLATNGPEKAVSNLNQGTLVAFPSWELHRVTRVTRGERWSLVCWIHGEPFR